MSNSLALFAIGLFFGTGAGFVVAAASGVTLDGHAHDHGGAALHGPGAAHAHVLHDVTGEAPTPRVALRLHPEAGGGLNVEVVTESFEFSPEAVNAPHEPGHGHAHLYLDGEKIARVYGRWFHLGSTPAEGGELRVTLNANDHAELALGADPIAAVAAIPPR
jgi:hypothetical protein